MLNTDGNLNTIINNNLYLMRVFQTLIDLFFDFMYLFKRISAFALASFTF